MFRDKTPLERSEDHRQEAARLRYALHVIHGLDDVAEMKRVAKCAMAGELHGHEMREPQTFRGMPVYADPAVGRAFVEFHHQDGRVDRYRLSR